MGKIRARWVLVRIVRVSSNANHKMGSTEAIIQSMLMLFVFITFAV